MTRKAHGMLYERAQHDPALVHVWVFFTDPSADDNEEDWGYMALRDAQRAARSFGVPLQEWYEREDVYHVRLPLRRRGGSQWYRDTSPREVGTYCGAPPTGYDAACTGKGNSWVYEGVRHVPCATCLAKREEARR